MTAVLGAFALFCAANVVAALWRVLRGPTAADRLLAPQLFGTTGIAVLLLLAEALGSPSLRDVAVVLALLALVTAAAFALRVAGSSARGEPEP